MTIIPSPNERTAYIEGLRRLADLLECNPEISLPRAGRRGKSHGHGTILFGDAEELVPLLGRPDEVAHQEYLGVRVVWHLAGLTIAAEGPVCPEEVTGIRIVNGREVPVTERATPEHLRPATEAEKAGVSA